MALGCPVELKLSLECPPSVVLEEIKASHIAAQSEPSTSEVKHSGRAKDHVFIVENVSSVESPPLTQSRQRRRKPKSRQELLTGLAARSRRLGDTGAGLGSDSRGSIKYCFPIEASTSCRHRLGRRPSLNRETSGRRDILDGQGVKVKWKYPKFKGIANLERKNRKLDPRRKRARAALCWQSPISEQGQQREQEQPQTPPEHSRKVTFFLRFVPCGRSTQTHESPGRP